MPTADLIRNICERLAKVETKMDIIFWMLAIVLGFILTQVLGFLARAIAKRNGNGNGIPAVEPVAPVRHRRRRP